MSQTTAISAVAVLAVIWTAPLAVGEMAGNKGDGPARQTEAQAAASASSSASTTSSPGAQGCEARAKSTASATAGGQAVYDSDEDIQESTDGGCQARAHSRATASSGTKEDVPRQD